LPGLRFSGTLAKRAQTNGVQIFMPLLGVSMQSFEPNLAARVDQAIQTNPYVSGRTLRFETEGSRVVLQGSVKSYFQKQMAQEVIRKVEGVEQIENYLEVLM